MSNITEIKKLIKIFNANQLNSLIMGDVQIHRHAPMVTGPKLVPDVGTDSDIDVIREMDREIEDKLRKIEQ